MNCRQIESMTSSAGAQDRARRAAEARLQGQIQDLESAQQAVLEEKHLLEVWTEICSINHQIRGLGASFSIIWYSSC